MPPAARERDSRWHLRPLRTQEEVARRLGIPRERVQALEKTALAKLRKALEQEIERGAW